MSRPLFEGLNAPGPKLPKPLNPEEILSCSGCGLEQLAREARMDLKGGQLVGRCLRCNAYLKCIPYADDPALPVGNKHRGKRYSEIAREDPGYLRWIVAESGFARSIKRHAQRALRELEAAAA